MKTKAIRFFAAALVVASAVAVTTAGCQKAPEGIPGGVTPADAGAVDGPEGFYAGETALLTAPEVDYATSYKWYRGSAPIEGQTGSTLVVSEVGIYRVAGVNEYGEGKASPAKPVRELTFTDRLVGEWDCKEYWVKFASEQDAEGTLYNNDHKVYIVRTGDLWENKIAIYNFFEANPPGTYTAFAETITNGGQVIMANGDTVVATVDEENRQILIPTSWQFTPTWQLGLNTELCPMIYDSAWSDNVGEAFPPQNVEELAGGSLKVKLVVGPLIAYIGQDQVPYPYSYMIAQTASTGYVSKFAVAIGTVWTKF